MKEVIITLLFLVVIFAIYLRFLWEIKQEEKQAARQSGSAPRHLWIANVRGGKKHEERGSRLA